MFKDKKANVQAQQLYSLHSGMWPHVTLQMKWVIPSYSSDPFPELIPNIIETINQSAVLFDFTNNFNSNCTPDTK